MLRYNAFMSLDSSKIAELKVKHLEMIQALVLRMSNQAATIKSYCITVTTAVCGFAITLQRPLVALIAILPITTFALLDAQYLRLERCFRALFERSRAEDWGTLPSFEISPKLRAHCPILEDFLQLVDRYLLSTITRRSPHRGSHYEMRVWQACIIRIPLVRSLLPSSAKHTSLSTTMTSCA